MKECTVDGTSMGIACEGSIDLSNKKMDLVILVAPFKTLDRIVKFLPLIGHVLGGKLISIPFQAKGDLKDPNVTPLHPTGIALIQNRRVDVVTRGEMLEQGQKIKVVKVEGNRIVVENAET